MAREDLPQFRLASRNNDFAMANDDAIEVPGENVRNGFYKGRLVTNHLAKEKAHADAVPQPHDVSSEDARPRRPVVPWRMPLVCVSRG